MSPKPLILYTHLAIKSLFFQGSRFFQPPPAPSPPVGTSPLWTTATSELYPEHTEGTQCCINPYTDGYYFPWVKLAKGHFPGVMTQNFTINKDTSPVAHNLNKHIHYTVSRRRVVSLLTFPGQASASSIFFLKLSLSCSMRLWWAEIIISLFNINMH